MGKTNYVFTKEILDSIMPWLVPGRDVAGMKAQGFIVEEYLDMGIAYLMPLHDKFIAVRRNNLLEMGVSEKELLEIAKRNIGKTTEMKPIDQAISEVIDSPPDSKAIESDLIVVCGNWNGYGASAIISPKVRRKIVNKFQGPAMVIPSSVHEVLVFPYCEDIAEESIETIKEINSTLVSDSEYLSDNLYMIWEDELEIYHPEKE